MSPERWQRIREICLEAFELDGDERARLLSARCGEDQELRAEVERLLFHYDDAPDYLEQALIDPDPDGPDATFIGPYRVVRRLGDGGMGTVYLAVREEPDFRLPVAVKVIRPGMDSEEVLRRFSLERRILATLSHPNIASILDAGTTADGRPYFVMEFIEGQRIDDYCSGTAATLQQRLRLVERVCDAVRHAHQNLVVHRDIKPSNVLVTAEGLPKLLDFGIGKLLEPTAAEAAGRTGTHLRVFTPEYAAPEQVRGEAVSAATDVYGLGLLLYRLLTGAHPYLSGDESPAEIEHAVCETEPARPSSLSANGAPKITADLETILLKALRKEPSRRYPSVADLAGDLERYREGFPITARADTATYRLGKFVRRNAWATTAVAAVLVGLVATSVVTVVQASRTAAERDNALQERDKALEVRGFLMEMFGATGPDAATDSVTARQLLDLQVSALVTAYDDRPELRAEMLEVLADGYERLGLFQEAEPLARRSLDLRREYLPPRHPDIAASLNMLGWIMAERGDPRSGLPLLEEAVSIRREAGPSQEIVLSRSLNDLGIIVLGLDQLAQAESILVEALEIRTRRLGEGHRSVGITANNVGAVLFYRGDYAGAAVAFARSAEALRRALGADHSRTLIAEANLNAVRESLGTLEDAEASYRSLLTRQIAAGGPYHPNVAATKRELGRVLFEAGRHEESRAFNADAVEAFTRSSGPRSAVVANAMMRVALSDAYLGRREAAMATLDEAESIVRELFGAEHSMTAGALGTRGGVHLALGEPSEAAELFREAVRLLDRTVGETSPRALLRRRELGSALGRAGAHDESLAEYQRLHELATVAASREYIHAASVGMLAAHVARGDRTAAEATLRDLRASIDSGQVAQDVREEVAGLEARLADLRR